MSRNSKTRKRNPAAGARNAGKKTPASVKAEAEKGSKDIHHQRIQREAYEIYQERVRTGQPGNAESDWLEAEGRLQSVV